MDWLKSFVRESNRIESIAAVIQKELDAHAAFLALDTVTIDALAAFVSVCAPGHRLRDKRGLNVRVVNRVAPSGGPDIRSRLEQLLAFLPKQSAYQNHVDYETLHPFTDGNGRSGRALWLWQKLHLCSYHEREQAIALGFLHTFYYEALANSRSREST